MSALSLYEQRALVAIEAWKNPETTFFDRVIAYVEKPVGFLGDLVLKTPWLGDVIQGTVRGLLSVTNDAAQYTVRTSTIVAEYRQAGFNVQSLRDLKRLDLEQIDTQLGWLSAKYKSLALAEGAGAGATGALGLALDIPALLALNFRAIGEYATYYGFDLRKQDERMFALAILHYAASPKDASKGLMMAEVVKVTKQAASKKGMKKLQESMLVKIIERVAASLNITLTKGKVAQMVPLIGAGVGGGFNAHFTGKVCDAAYNLYRERFLVEKDALHGRSGAVAPRANDPDDTEIEDAEYSEVPPTASPEGSR